MELRQLHYFEAVAEARSFSRAAEKSHVTQPSLSRQIQLLESEVGLKLFNRHQGGADLTEAGERFLLHARRILDEVNRAQVSLRDLEALKAGHVRLAALATLGTHLLPDTLARYGRDFPGVRVTVTTGRPQEIERMVSEGLADIGLTFVPADDETLLDEPLLQEDVALALQGTTPPLSTSHPLHLSELAEDPLITLPAEDALRDVIDKAFARAGVTPKVHMEVPDVHTIVDLVRAGLGYSLLPTRALRPHVQRGDIRALALDDPECVAPIGAVHRRGRYRCHGSRALLEYLRETIARASE